MGNLTIMDTPKDIFFFFFFLVLILNFFAIFFAFFSVYDLSFTFGSDNFEETLLATREPQPPNLYQRASSFRKTHTETFLTLAELSFI